MTLPAHKTKLVCTIGPASQAPETLQQLIQAGMNVARLNFSHGDFDSHAAVIAAIRAAAKAVGQRVAIMADLPGPKMRIGRFAEEPIELQTGDPFTLTSEDIVGDRQRVSVSFSRLPQVVKPGNTLFLNDGFVQLQVETVAGNEVHCRVRGGGELRSRKGLNLPGIDLGMCAFTERDHECLKFVLEQGVDAVSQSFVANATDVQTVRQAAAALGGQPFIIAKIERSIALENIEAILQAADGIMIARGDLGVEYPIERIAVVQKTVMDKARAMGKPVITATQMLESMVSNRRPTRAEATDVANAILDGTDCVMLSEESAMGKYPVAAAAMLASIAAATEPYRTDYRLQEALKTHALDDAVSLADLIALSVYFTAEQSRPVGVLVPTHSGAMARNITRFRLPVWIAAVSHQQATCQQLQFSFGVQPQLAADYPDDWAEYARDWLQTEGLTAGLVLLTQGPSRQHPDAHHRLEVLDLRGWKGERFQE